jgi:hypothetical protein
MVTRLPPVRHGVRILEKGKSFSEVNSAYNAMRSGVISRGLKRPGCDVDHSNPSVAEIKDE